MQEKFGMAIVDDLRYNFGIFVSLVVYPVVPKNVILLRVIPTASHTFDDIEKTLNAFKEVRQKITNGTYKKQSEKIKI